MAETGKKQRQKPIEEDRNSREKKQEELLRSFGDLNSKDDWDQFFTATGGDDPFEWYAEWPQLQSLLTSQLAQKESSGAPRPAMKAADVCILVPGCGNSRLSENLYDAGYRNITNVDFSKVVISDMLRRNVRKRPMMKWRVMDMTNMQFKSQTFDFIVDKGGLDALMKPKLGSDLGNLYLAEVKRLVKNKGRYICLTLAESHVLDLLFCKFPCWWKMSLHAIAKEPSARNLKLQTFMVVAEKDISSVVSEVSSLLQEDSVDSTGDQVRGLCDAFEREMKVRSECSDGSDILHLLDDPNPGVKENLAKLKPGRRAKLILGEPGVSRFFYNALVFDAQQDSGPFDCHCAAFLVPKRRAGDWLFTSSEGQWLIVERSRAARLALILLDSSNFNVATEVIQRDLSPLIKQLMPQNCDDGGPIRFILAADGIKRYKIVHQVTSALAGPIVVQDVIYAKIYDVYYRGYPSSNLVFRRLMFPRTENLLQSEAVLTAEGPNGISSEAEKNQAHTDSDTRKQKNFDSDPSLSAVFHNYLASSYHNGIICGLRLIPALEGYTSDEGMVKTVVIGLRAGVLPMFMRNCLPALEIEVIELDPSVLSVARDCFGFREDERLKISLGDGIRFVMKKAEDSESDGKDSSKISIIIVDVDSSSPSYALTCPEADFVEQSFLSGVKSVLSEQGVFIFNLVSRSSAVKRSIYSSLKMVFSNVFSLNLEEDLNEVIFAVKTESPINGYQLSNTCERLTRALEQQKPYWGRRITDASKNIKLLK